MKKKNDKLKVSAEDKIDNNNILLLVQKSQKVLFLPKNRI